MIRALLPVFALLCFACGSGTHISGTYKGHPVDVASDTLVAADVGDNGKYSLVLISDQQNICRAYSIGLITGGQTLLLLQLAIVTPYNTLAPPGVAGSYSVLGRGTAGTKIAAAWFGVLGEVAVGDHSPAKSGTVTLTHVEAKDGVPSHLEGSFALEFDNGDKMSGDLDVDVCNPNTT